MRKILAAAALASAFLISACNTVEGVGRDVSSAGTTVADAADDAKH
ncbi:MAG: entericidin A/B family lipoprotein [Pseudomonadota bacterium]